MQGSQLSGFTYKQQSLYAEGVAVSDLLEIYGSPVYIYSQNQIKQNWHKFNQAFGAHPHLICYSVKANSNLAVLSTLAKIGSGFDIVSQGELERVLAVGADPKLCVFSGVAKTTQEIEYALKVGIYCFNVESISELERIESIATRLNIVAPISIRVNPNVDAKTHPYISTGMQENKFGVDTDDAIELYYKAHKSKYLAVKGIDCHIGSQITEISPFLDALDKLIVIIDQLSAKGIVIEHVDLGGGVGIVYDDEQTINIADYISRAVKKVGNIKIIIEPGRAIVGDAGVFITKVEFLKRNAKKSFAIIDGAMNDLLRPAFYNSYHKVLPVVQNDNGIKANWDIVGPICETGDFLAKDRILNIATGDYLAFMCTGAYGFTMSSNYNSRPRVAEVMVANDKHQLIRQRETIQQLFSNEHVFID